MAREQHEQDVFWAEYLDEEQEAAVVSMMTVLSRRGIEYPGHSDRVTLARFLKARKWDVAKAVQMYQEMVSFRKERQLDSPDYHLHFPELHQVKAVYPHFYHKTDKWGRPVYYELIGDLDALELMRVTTVDRLVAYHIHCWEITKRERLPAASKSIGRDVFTTVTVLDLAGFSISQFTTAIRAFVAKVCKIDQDNYPEHLGQMYIVNAPMIFSGIWCVVKPWLEVRTQKKIHVISCAKQSKEQLLSIIPAENLPERLGGLSKLDQSSLDAESAWDAEMLQERKGTRFNGTLCSSTDSDNIGVSIDKLPEST